MGVILINFGYDVQVIAQGGFKSISIYFVSALNRLTALSELLGGHLHLIYLDKDAWSDYQAFDSTFLEGVTKLVAA